jgi:hypothetical protein
MVRSDAHVCSSSTIVTGQNKRLGPKSPRRVQPNNTENDFCRPAPNPEFPKYQPSCKLPLQVVQKCQAWCCGTISIETVLVPMSFIGEHASEPLESGEVQTQNWKAVLKGWGSGL